MNRAITCRVFGVLSSGEVVKEYKLTNHAGMIVRILDYGGIITGLHVPDRQGQLADIVLGFDDLASYERQHAYFGAIIGRYAGRIARGQFSINDNDFKLIENSNGNHLHGGERGFDKVIWNSKIGKTPGQLTLRYTSKDGEQGYPGNLDVRVSYTLTDDNGLRVEYFAITDTPTVLNLTQHSYFNLSPNLDSNVLDHRLQVNADYILELDNSLIPTGAYLSVDGTPFDFRASKPIGEDIQVNHPQLLIGGGYDHTWVLANDNAAPLEPKVVLEDEQNSRRMEVLTTQPGIQIYTANFLDGSVIGKSGQAYQKHAAICLETQHYPDSPNHAEFPGTLLLPGETFHSETVFQF